MVFSEASSGYSQIVTPTVYDKLTFDDSSKVYRDLTFKSYINSEGQLVCEWNNLLLIDKNEVYRSSAATLYNISEKETPAPDAFLIEVLQHSYSKNKEWFNERRSEFPVFRQMIDIPLADILEVLPDLRITLLSVQA